MRINIPFFTRYIRYFLLFRTYIGNRYFILIALAVVASLIEGLGFTLFFPLLEMESASAAQTSNNLSAFIDGFFRFLHLETTFLNVLILLVIVFFLKSIASFALEAYRAHLLAQVVRVMNNGLVSAYSKMNYSYYLQQNTGFLNNVVTVESTTAVSGFNRFCQVTSVMVTSIAFLSLSAYINWKFTVFALAIGLTIGFFLRFIFRISEKLSYERSDTRGCFTSLADSVAPIFQIPYFYGKIRTTSGQTIKNSQSFCRAGLQTSIGRGCPTLYRTFGHLIGCNDTLLSGLCFRPERTLFDGLHPGVSTGR